MNMRKIDCLRVYPLRAIKNTQESKINFQSNSLHRSIPYTCATMKWASSFLTSRSRHGDPQLKLGCLLSVGN